MDLRREKDIEHLRRIALAQQVQIEQLLRVLKSKCEELEALKGNPEELQQTLALIETLTKQKTAAAEAVTGASNKKGATDRKRREQFGATCCRARSLMVEDAALLMGITPGARAHARRDARDGQGTAAE